MDLYCVNYAVYMVCISLYRLSSFNHFKTILSIGYILKERGEIKHSSL
jgi:hypothetical protein